jgi:hypothetical protein
LREKEITEDDDAGEDIEEGEARDTAKGYRAWKWAMASRPLTKGRLRHIDPKTGKIVGDGGLPFTSMILTIIESDDQASGECGACAASSNKAGPILRPLRFGAPFLIGNAALFCSKVWRREPWIN